MGYSKDLKSSNLENTQEYISRKGLKESASNLIPKGTLIIATRMALGKAVFFNRDVTINQDLKAIFPSAKLGCLYLFHWFIANASFIESLGSGSTVKGIRLEVLKSLKFILPPLPEQQKIATILGTVDEKIEVIEAQIAQTQQLKKGLMQKLLTEGIGHTRFKDSALGRIPECWKVVKLGDLVTKVGSGITPKGGHESYLSEGVTFVRSQNVLVNKLVLDDIAFISPAQHEKMGNSKLRPMDVLLNITGASIGRCCLVPMSLEEGNVNQHVCIIRPIERLSPIYLSQLLNSTLGWKQIDKFQAGGNREGLNFQQIRSFDIPLPSVKEQSHISNILISLDEKTEILESKKEHFQQLKKGLMQQLLTGRVRVLQAEVLL